MGPRGAGPVVRVRRLAAAAGRRHGEPDRAMDAGRDDQHGGRTAGHHPGEVRDGAAMRAGTGERGRSRARVPRGHAFTLIEAVVIVVILAIAVPVTLVTLDEANQRRADSVNATRATALATCVMEHMLADVASRNASL